MHHLLVSLFAVAVGSTAVAATKPAVSAATPAATIEQALRCELPLGQFARVQQALKRAGARPGSDGVEGSHVLANPVHPFGLAVTRLSANADEVESYIATLPGARLEDVARAAQLKKTAGSYGRDTRHGTLQADVRERGEVWLMCTVTQ